MGWQTTLRALSNILSIDKVISQIAAIHYLILFFKQFSIIMLLFTLQLRNIMQEKKISFINSSNIIFLLYLNLM